MIKKNKFLVCTITLSYLKNAMWKKLNRNDYKLHESIYVKCFKKQIIKNENGSAFAWLRMEARIRCKPPDGDCSEDCTTRCVRCLDSSCLNYTCRRSSYSVQMTSKRSLAVRKNKTKTLGWTEV